VTDFHRRALYLEYFTIAYNTAEAIASIGFGYLAGSIALVGFGLDSVVESLSGLVLIWRLRKHGVVSVDEESLIEKRAVKFVALTFFILGAYVTFRAVQTLLLREAAEPSVPGMVIAILSLVVMPLLAWRKIVIARQIGSRALLADAKETLACAFLSVALLTGLACNYFFGFWQADPLAALVIAVFLFREGYGGWREETEEPSLNTPG
jgi:divalent metal cation (Fe/Co/Zn/Cd) transporter